MVFGGCPNQPPRRNNMNSLDYSRKFDLEQLAEQLQDDRLSKRAKYEVEEAMNKIINQSTEVSYLREQLIKATRGGDTRAIRQLQYHIQRTRQQETSGRDW